MADNTNPQPDFEGGLPSPFRIIQALFAEATAAACPPSVEIGCNLQSSQRFGDYQYNSAMGLFKKSKKKLKAESPFNSPQEAAQAVIDALPENAIIDSCEISGPGFVNVYVSPAWSREYVVKTLTEGLLPPPGIESKKVVIDYSSPNIAKEMHVGHLRSTIIGDSIRRLFEFVGFDVVPTNHVGDFGTQFGMLIQNLKELHPDFVENTPPIADLQDFYRAAKRRFDEEPEFKELAYQEVVNLQSGSDDSTVKGWELICEISRQEFRKIYDRMWIDELIERGESFYRDQLPGIVDFYTEKEMVTLEDADGREGQIKCVFVPNPKQPKAPPVPLIVEKSDGGYTYATTDLAALKYRVQDQGADWVIYVVDNGQSSHLEQVFEASRQAGVVTDQRVEHVGFGVVLGSDGKKFKTRSGDVVKLVSLLDEADEGALAVIEERGWEGSEEDKLEAAAVIGTGCVKYADLKNNRNSDYKFSFDAMLSQKGNTAVYLLYAHVRLTSIIRNSGVDVDELATSAADILALEHPSEIKLTKTLARFSDEILFTLDDLLPSRICEYLYNVSSDLTSFYDDCRVIDAENIPVQNSRLLICQATLIVMRRCFDILGLRYLQRLQGVVGIVGVVAIVGFVGFVGIVGVQSFTAGWREHANGGVPCLMAS